jgi:septal ring factor EnvC (AmiA/AmiB activator)
VSRSRLVRELVLAVVMLAALASALCAAAQSQPAEKAGELTRVHDEVRQIEEHLRALESAKAGLGHEREVLDAELRLAGLRVREAEQARAVADAAVAPAERAAAESQVALERAMERLRVQVSLLVMLGRAGLLPLVLEAATAEGDPAVKVTLALVVVGEQKRRRDEAVALMEERTAVLAVLSRRREEAESATRQLEARRRDLVAVRERVEAKLAALEKERRTGAGALAGAREAEERLERLWGAIESRTGLESDVRLLRGGLSWPLLAARVVQGFGPHRDPRYGTVTVSHGIVLAARAGSDVRAIAAGTVAYAQFFKGYGNVVIVSHGSEVYSLYGRLASMLVGAGKRVATGDPLGLMGRDEQGGGETYFEIRVGKNAEDPMVWLKGAGK